MIIFPLNFDVKVGFTYRQVIQQKAKKLRTQTNDEESLDDHRMEQGMGSFLWHMASQKINKQKMKVFNYPAELKPGQPIGLFELAFNSLS